MSKHSDRGTLGSSKRNKRGKTPARCQERRLGFEGLETRRLLSTVGLSSISNVTLPAGATVLVALNGSDPGNTVKFGVTSSDPTSVTPILMPSSNPSVQFDTADGDMTFQLLQNLAPNTVSHIETLVNDGFYNGDYIYRAETGSFALIQGGNNPPQFNNGADVNPLPSGVPTSIDEEYSPDLNYTTAGDLAMARTSMPNSSGTEFFVTDGATRNLDYAYTLFGFQTLGSSALQTLDNLPTTADNGIDYLDSPVAMTASMVTDTQDGVLMLRAPTGVTGSYTVQVTAYDGTNTPTMQSFTVNVVTDNSVVNANPWASDTPAAPTGVTFMPSSSAQGTSTVTSVNNSSDPDKLEFQVSGATSGDTVTIYANGVAIGSGVAGTPADIFTDGSTSLANGTYTITATESVDGVSVTDSADGGQTETANVDSLMSTGSTLTVFNGLSVTSTPAQTANVGSAYSYTVTTNAPNGDTVTVTPGGTLPGGMTFDQTTDTFNWTPTSTEEGTNQSFSYTVSDAAGNTVSTQTANVAVSGPTLTVTSTPPATGTVGQAYTYTVTTGAPSTDTIAVAAASGTTLPAGMTITGDTVTWTPTADEEGANQFTLTVTDSTAGSTATVGPVSVEVSGATGLTVIAPPPTIAVGSPDLLAFNDTNSGTPTYTVTTSNPSALTATLNPQTNEVLKVVTSLGEMDFQLLNNYTPDTVAHFASLVDSGTFNSSASFYRIIEDFMIQGGVGGAGGTIPVELSPDLRFTTSGLLAMANDGVDGNSSEFFVTGPNDTGSSTDGDFSDGFLDFRYTIFGKLISGDNVRQEIAALPVTTNTSSGERSKPENPPTIESMSITTETNAGVFLLSAASGATGSYTVTVSDGLGGTQSFTVNVGANPYDPPNPWVEPVTVGANSSGTNPGDQIYTSENTAVQFTPQGESTAGAAAPEIAVQVFRSVPGVSGAYVDDSYVGTSQPAETTNTDISVTQNGSTYTLTPATGYYGMQVLEVTGEDATPASWDAGADLDPVYRAYVPVYVNPPAPVISSVTAAGQTVSGSTFANNSSSSSELTFNISGAEPGATVSVYDGATELATGTVASGATSISLTTNGTSKIADGSNDFVVSESIATPALELYADWQTSGTFVLQVGTGSSAVTTSAITFDGADPTTTASNIESALTAAGLSVTSVTVLSGTVVNDKYGFQVTFSGSQQPISYDSSASDLGVNFGNSAASAAAVQDISFVGASPGAKFPIAASSVNSSNSINLTIGLSVLLPPPTEAQAGAPFSYVLQTNAPSGDTVTVTPVTLPPGMQFTAPDTFTWTPSTSQLNTSLEFTVDLSDSAGNTAVVGPYSISVILGLAPVDVPVNATSGGDISVSFSGDTVVVFNNVTQSALLNTAFKSSDTVEIDLPAGQANVVMISAPNSATSSMPKEVEIQGASGATNNSVIVTAQGANNTLTVSGDTATANGLVAQFSGTNSLSVDGFGSSNYFNLESCTTNVWVHVNGGNNTLDFSQDTSGVVVNLGLDRGQAQKIAPWNTSLMLCGVFDTLIGSNHNDTLTAGPAASTEILAGKGNDFLYGGSNENVLVGGGGNDTIVGGSGKNLLIGGAGNDTIVGEGSENIIFGGATNYDANDQALLNLLNQGPNFMYGYSVRRALLSIRLDPALASSMLHFEDDGSHDTIYDNSSDSYVIPGANDRVI